MQNNDLYSLYRFNSLGVDASAEAVDTVENDQELLFSLELANRSDQSVIILGAGTNVVFAGHISSRVIRQSTLGVRLLGSIADKVHIRANAGENWHDFVLWTISNKCYGLENLALIPGNVGAVPVQNVGAFGIEIQSFVTKVNCINISSGEFLSLDKTECDFNYRDSRFKRDLRDQLVILSVDFELSRVPQPILTYPLLVDWISNQNYPETPEGVLEAVVSLRKSRLPDPDVIPNVGSFFKNPIVSEAIATPLSKRFPDLPKTLIEGDGVKLSAAWMIEYCGWRGYEKNGVGISSQHSLVLINTGAVSGGVILDFASDVKLSVKKEFGLELELEPRVVGL